MTAGPVLVTRTTGRQGGAVPRHLLERGWPGARRPLLRSFGRRHV